MNNRPAFIGFDWASIAQFDAPALDWDGQESSIRPSAGFIAAGFHPDTPWPAEYVNWALRDLGLRARHLDAIDIRNWTETSSLGALADNVTGASFMRRSSGLTLLIACENGDLLHSEDGGYTWAVEVSLSAGHACRDVATRERTDASDDDYATCMIHDNHASTGGVGSVAGIRITGKSAGWTTLALTGTGVEQVRRVQPDRWRGGFWVSGQIAANDPAVYRIADVKGVCTLAEISYLTLAGVSNCMGPLAIGPSFALGANSDLTGLDIYGWEPDVDTALTLMTSPAPTLRIADLLYDDATGYFVAVFALAGTPPAGIQIWRSSTGQNGTWTNVTPTWMASAYRPLTTTGRADGGCARGSVITLAIQRIAGSVVFIALSLDGGLTWELLPDPLGRLWATVTPDPKSTMIRIVDRRAIVVSSSASGDTYMVQSLRTG